MIMGEITPGDWIAIIGIGVPILGGLIHIVMVLAGMRSDLQHLQEEVRASNSERRSQDSWVSSKIESHEARIVAIETRMKA